MGRELVSFMGRLQVHWYAIGLWLFAIVFSVWPEAHDSFHPIKGFLLVTGLACIFPLLLCMGQKGLKEIKGRPGPWIWVLLSLGLWTQILPDTVFLSPPRHVLESIHFLGLMAGAGVSGLVLLCDGQKTLIRLWIGLGCMQAVLVILQAFGLDPFYLWTGTHGTWRVYGTMGNPNLVAGLLLPLVVLSQCPEFVPGKRVRQVLFFIMALAVLATGSRAGAGILFITFLLQFIILPRTGKVGPILFLSGTVLGAFAVGAFMGKGLASVGGRWVFWQAGYELIKQNPWTGYGLGHFQALYPQGVSLLSLAEGAPLALPVHAHNDWIEYAVELGIVPAVLLFCVALWAIQSAYTSGQGYLSLALVSMTLFAFWDSSLHTIPTALLFFMLLGSVRTGTMAVKKKTAWLVTYVCLLAVVVVSALWGAGLLYDNVRAHSLAGKAQDFALEEEWDRAMVYWEKAHALSPSQGEFAYWLSQGLAMNHRYTCALPMIKEAQKTYSRFHLYSFRARLEYYLGYEEEAISLLQWLTDTFPGYTAGRYLLQEFSGKAGE